MSKIRRVAYCGGILKCGDNNEAIYEKPKRSNVENISADTVPSLDDSQEKNHTDADAYIFEGDEVTEGNDTIIENKKLHIFKSNCSPIMKCEYNSSGGNGEDPNTIKIIHNQSEIWKKVINRGSENGDETTVMGNPMYYKYRIGSYETDTDGEPKYTGFFNSPKTVEFFFVNQNGTSDIPSATTEGMFKGCVNLVSCDVPCQMRKISDNTFLNCWSLTSYTTNLNFIEEIGYGAFDYCSGMEEIAIGQFSKISPLSFAHCSGATHIRWDNLDINGNEKKCNMEEIPDSAFTDCVGLNYTTAKNEEVYYSIVIPSGITKIGEYAFNNCSNITRLDLKDVKEIESYAFFNCHQLNEIQGFSNVTFVGDYAFSGSAYHQDTTSFGSLSAVTEIGTNAFATSHFDNDIDLQSCESIGSYAFSGATFYDYYGNIKSVTLYGQLNNDTQVYIGYGAFDNCEISAVTFKNSINYDEGIRSGSRFNGAKIEKIILEEDICYAPSNHCFYGIDTDQQITEVYIYCTSAVIALENLFDPNDSRLNFYVRSGLDYSAYDINNWHINYI